MQNSLLGTKTWPGPSDPFRIRFVTPPYAENLSDSQADVVVLRSDDPRTDVYGLIDALDQKDTPLIVLSPRWHVQDVVDLFQNRHAEYLVEDDYCTCTLTPTVVGSVSGLTSAAPVVCAVLKESMKIVGESNLAAARELRARLTRREQEVMDLASHGYGIREVSECLGISEKTLRNYLSNIYAKLNARDYTDAVLRWMGVVVEPTGTAWPSPRFGPGV